MEQVQQLIYNVIFTKDIYDRVFDYIYPWGENLTSIALKTRKLYQPTIGYIKVQSVHGIDILLLLN